MTKMMNASLAATTAVLSFAAAGAAHAQAFYLQEQSARGAGRAFSGEAADTGADSLWWNPASIAGIDHREISIHAAGILPNTLGADLHGYNVKMPDGGRWYRGMFTDTAEMEPPEDASLPFSTPYGIHHAMSEMLALGVTLPQVVTRDPETGDRNIGIFSTDMDSFDFKIHKPEQVIKSVMTKLAKHGKGIILMHDFQHGTSEAAPELLKQLKAGGYKVVQVVGKTPVEPLPQYKDEVVKEMGGGLDEARPMSSVIQTIQGN